MTSRSTADKVSQTANISKKEVISGHIERVTFHSEEGFCVLQVNVRGHREPQSVIGNAPAVSPGEWVTATGEWVHDRKFGYQFRAFSMHISAPTSLDAIEKYFSSGMVRGIGAVYASKLVAAFGDKVFDVIESEPDKLQDVEGIGPKRAEGITSAWAEQKSVRDIMLFLHSHGVGTARAVRIFKAYGVYAVQVISKNPYRLARDIRGIGFRTADEIAMKLGIEKTAMVRVRAGISHALEKAMEEGHCFLPHEELLENAQKLLDVPDDLISTALEHELQEDVLVSEQIGEKQCIFLALMHHAEKGVAESIKNLMHSSLPWSRIDVNKAIPWVEQHLSGLKLAESQVDAVRRALNSKVMVLTGGPGVGKTTIVNAILKILQAKKVKIALCAPTGRAAKRLGDVSGMEAKTIHRLLEFDPVRRKFRRDEENLLECNLLVVDESSMIDVLLMNSLLQAVPKQAALLLVGDVDQLPSVGPGQVLADLIASNKIPVARLREVFRQSSSSRIVVNAHYVNRGLIPDLERTEGESDFYFVHGGEPQDIVQKIRELVCFRIPKKFKLDPIRDIQVLCPMTLGEVGSKSLNLKLQAFLNPGQTEKVERFGWTYTRGDKVMQIQNDYDKNVYNGDIGFVHSLDKENEELMVDFDGRHVVYRFNELDLVVPAYATTIHKSQGSEYPAVIIPLVTQHYIMLKRKLIYTGITRGKQLVVLIGHQKAVSMAVKTVKENERWTNLKQRLENSS